MNQNNTNNNSSGQQLQSQQSRDLTQLKKQIQLSNLQLLQLTYNDEKFINYIYQLNNKGINSVINDQYRQAVVYFNQSQKILEYAASCGKTIDRSVIVVTLHNQACVNQKLWDLQKSANYLEAIIYNINFYFENGNNNNNQNNNNNNNNNNDNSTQLQLQQLCSLTHKKQMYALYYLQFCAVNSQIRKHAISLNSAKTAITIMKNVCKQSYAISQKIIYKQLSQINIARQNSNILKQLMNLNQQLTIHDYQKYFQIIRELLADRDRNKSVSEDQYKSIRTFSIGKLMQLIPISIEDMHTKLTAKDWVQHENIVTLALYLGVCYFTVGTELRFISSQNSQQGNQVYKLSQDFLISQVYHIYAIMVVLKYVPVKTIFLNHLLTSFSSHYQIDLDKIISSIQQQPQIRAISNNKEQKKQPQNVSYSQQLHLAASILPQQSSIKAQTHTQKVQLQYSPQVKSQQIPSKKQLKAAIQNLQIQTDNQTSAFKQKSSRNKLQKVQIEKKISTKMKKNQSNSRSRSRRQLLKHQTYINVPKKLQHSKHQNSLRNKSSSKTKSDFSPNKTNKQQKFCIYTTKIKKDVENVNGYTNEKTSQKKIKSKQKSNSKIPKQKVNGHPELKKKVSSKQKQLKRNLIGKLSKKSPSPKRHNQKQSNSKSKCQPVKQPVKQKMKMKKVQSSKFSKIGQK